MVSDFFYPNMGGVESHIFQLSQCLLERGHKVIVVTHMYDDRIGVKYMTNFLKVYYLPIVPFYNNSSLPTIVGSLPYLRKIFIKENVTIVHGHSAFSSLCHEALFVASLLDIPSVFTDHSLFGFSDASAIVTNTFLKYSLVNTSHTICVSHTGKENTVLRSEVAAENVSVIPNAVDSVKFSPSSPPINTNSDIRQECSGFSSCDSTNASSRTVTIVVGSRLVYRKGIDLLVQILPVLCTQSWIIDHHVKLSQSCDSGIGQETDHITCDTNQSKLRNRDNVISSLYESNDELLSKEKSRVEETINFDFIIAGDGPKRILLEEVIEKHNLQNRVTMLGTLQHSEIRDKLLIKGDIFLNTSLTEAFCMAIVEAVSCGLSVVSTNVGGIPEVLPPRFIHLVEPNVDAILFGIKRAVKEIVDGTKPSAAECNQFVQQAYNWRDVAHRTEKVYTVVTARKTPDFQRKVRNLWDCGSMAGPVMSVLFVFCHYWCLLLSWLSW